jgi:menaquinone-dependent protoporphyrinogen IX oxidase
MKILVAYFSQSGNTKKIAEAIYEAAPFQKELKQVSDIKDVNPYDLLFVGFPIQVFGPADQGKDFMNVYCQNKPVALFITHAVPDTFEDLPLWIDRCKEPVPETNVMGIFDCQGEVSSDLLSFAQKSDDPVLRKLGGIGPSAKGQPDAIQLERARSFTQEIVARFPQSTAMNYS